MRTLILQATLVLVFTWLNGIAVGQTTVTFVDSSGAPVAAVDAVFFNGGFGKPIETKEGIGTVKGSEGVVAATAEGFQYSGGILDSKELKIVLLREDETAPSVRQIEFPISDSIRAKTSAALVAAIKKRIVEEELNPNETARQMSLAGKLDPTGTLAWLKENDLPQKPAMMVRNGIIDGFLRDDFETAIDMLDQIKNPIFKTFKLVSLLSELPAQHPAASIIEKQAVAAVRNVKQAAYRIAMWGTLAEHYQISGQDASVRKIVDQHLEDVQKLPSDGWSSLPRSVFAAVIIEEKPDVALKMIEGVKNPNEKWRAEARLAFHCCRTNPELAVELLRRYEAPEGHGPNTHHVVKILERMAVEQTAAAETLADSIETPNDRAWALGLMALRVNEKNPTKAKLLLEKAIKTLADPNANQNHLHTSGSTMAGLLHIAQQVAPEKVKSMIWEAAFRAIPQDHNATANQKLQHAAGAIARFDRDLALALFDVEKLELGDSSENTAFHQAVLKVEDLPAYAARVTAAKTRIFRHQQKLVDVLLADEETFWQSVSKPIQMDWPTLRFEEQP